MRWTGNVACMGFMRNSDKIFVGKPEGRNNSKDLDVEGKIILKSFLEKWAENLLTGFIWLRISISGGIL
jgi:hypothetical protein